MPFLRRACARIECGIEEIDEEIDRDEEQGRQHYISHHHRSIQLVDRIDQKFTHAGLREDGLGYCREGDETANSMPMTVTTGI